jgi:hypothetical protein
VSLTDAALVALAEKWCARARTYRSEARASVNARDVHRLAGMTSSWEFAARELFAAAGIEPTDESRIVNMEADRAQREAVEQLTRDSRESQL